MTVFHPPWGPEASFFRCPNIMVALIVCLVSPHGWTAGVVVVACVCTCICERLSVNVCLSSLQLKAHFISSNQALSPLSMHIHLFIHPLRHPLKNLQQPHLSGARLFSSTVLVCPPIFVYHPAYFHTFIHECVFLPHNCNPVPYLSSSGGPSH